MTFARPAENLMFPSKQKLNRWKLLVECSHMIKVSAKYFISTGLPTFGTQQGLVEEQWAEKLVLRPNDNLSKLFPVSFSNFFSRDVYNPADDESQFVSLRNFCKYYATNSRTVRLEIIHTLRGRGITPTWGSGKMLLVHFWRLIGNFDETT